MILKPTSRRFAGTFFVAFFTLVWNGIIGLFIFQLIQQPFGVGTIFLGLFLTPFVLVGTLLLLVAAHSILSLFNPTVEIDIPTTELRLGSSTGVRWQIRGRRSRIVRLILALEGQEEVSYMRGTTKIQEKRVFASMPLLNVDSPPEQGVANVNVPADVMHSFAARNNKIAWSLRVHGEIRRWPDIADEFELTIKPQVGE